MKVKFSFRLLYLHTLLLSVLLNLAGIVSADAKDYFAVSPYVQLGYKYHGNNYTVVWLSEEANTKNLVFEYLIGTKWTAVEKIYKQGVHGHPQLSLFSAEMSKLPFSSSIKYRIRRDNKEIFQAEVKSPPAPGKPVDFAVLGDIGQGTEGESAIAQLWKRKSPPLLMIMGDIVYPIGTVNYYRQNFYPYLNSDGARAKGASVLRSTLTVGVPGNHDLAEGGMLDARNLDVCPDSLAYFVLWKQPLNGPLSEEGGYTRPVGSNERVLNFTKAAGEAYPRMSNFSFDYGDCHFLALDGNSYMDWMEPKLRAWVEKDLQESKKPWKIVTFHQPGFNSDFAHREEQRMRHLADIFERTGVNICFSGHSHSYQRSFPLHFKEVKSTSTDREAQIGYVYGSFKLDKAYDGSENTKPDGIIYVVSGAGGAMLSPAEIELHTREWLPFTKKFISSQHSITFCHAEGNRLSIQQQACDGTIIDSFSITK